MARTLQAWYGRHKVLVWITAGLVMLYTIAGFVVTPLIVHHLLKTKVAQQINRQVNVGTVRTNPYTFTLRLTELSLAEPDGDTFVEIEEFSLNAQPLISLFKWGIVIRSVNVKAPSIRLVRSAIDRFNVSDMVTSADPEARKDTSSKSTLPRFLLTHFKMEQGRIDYIDQTTEAPFRSTLSSIAVAIDHLDTLAEAGPAQVTFSASSEVEERIKAEAQVDVSPLVVTATFSTEDIQIPKYAPYYGPMINADIAKGLLSVAGKTHWSEDRQSVEDLSWSIQQLAVTTTSSERTAIRIPEFTVAGAGMDIIGKTIQLGRVSSRNGEINAWRNADGDINLLSAFVPSPAEPEAVDKPVRETPETGPQWIIHLPELELDGYAFKFKDEQVRPPSDLSVAPLALHASNLTTKQDERGTVALNLVWGDQGTVSMEGQVGLTPLVAQLDVKAGQLDIRPLQPYIGEHVHLVVTQGTIDT